MLNEVKKFGVLRGALSRELYFGPFVDRRVAAFHISKKRRNLFLTITDITGAVVNSLSAKFFASNRKKRFAPHVVELIVRRLSIILRAYRINTVRLFTKIAKPYLVKATIRALKASGFHVSFAMDYVAVAHNGCRKKKRRRL